MRRRVCCPRTTWRASARTGFLLPVTTTPIAAPRTRLVQYTVVTRRISGILWLLSMVTTYRQMIQGDEHWLQLAKTIAARDCALSESYNTQAVDKYQLRL